jgi:hypothetical protein
MNTTKLQTSEFKKILMDRVKKFQKNNYSKYTTGIQDVGRGVLKIEVGNELSLHIDPNQDLITLVDNITLGSVDASDIRNINILNYFFRLLEEKIQPIIDNLRVDLAGRFILKSGLLTLSIDTEELYLRSELWYYKSLFSGCLASYCFNPRGVYDFALPDGNVLHIFISRIYLDDSGLYIIENRSESVSEHAIRPSSDRQLLAYLKLLCENPEKLQNLATL